MLSLRLLGTFSVSLDGRRVETFSSNKERALLAYLMVEADRPHPRNQLTTLLWPDLPPDKARNNFRVTLHRLRQTVEHPNAAVIRATRETVGINPDVDVQVDANVLAQKLEAVRQHNDGSGPCPACHVRLTRAVELYGGPFLAGLTLDGSQPFEAWVRHKREWHHLRVLDALAKLVQYHRWRGDSELAQEYAYRQVALEPWRERAHRQLILTLACNGDYSAALAQFEACRQILANELGVDPSSKTMDLHERVMAARETHFRPLPNASAPLIGREQELAQLIERLADPTCRLLTLVGPGGVGKSRLALAVARKQKTAFLHNICYVPLAAVDSTDGLVGAIVRAADYRFQNQGGRRAELLSYLEEKELLLVLDNFEHLVSERELLSELLASAPEMKALVTSRVRLNLKEEQVVELQGLTYPEQDRIEELESYGSVKLFLDRAKKAQPRFELSSETAPSVSQLCRYLAGMPLAIELAAAWSRVLTPQQTLAHIRQSLGFLESSAPDIPDRHRSIRASFEHSWALLDKSDRDGLMKLSLFRGGFTVEAAREVAGASLHTLLSLVDHSLLWHDGSAGRLDMHELLRQFAKDKLHQTEQTYATQDAHSAYYLGLLCRLGEQVKGGKRQVEALDTIDAEFENVRAAWRWAVENRAYERLQDAIDTLYLALRYRNRREEGELMFRRAASLLESRADAGSKRLLGPIRARRAAFLSSLLHSEEALRLLEHSLAAARQRGARAEIAFCLQVMGTALFMRDGPRKARPMLEETLAIAEAIDARWIQIRSLLILHDVVMLEGRHREGIQLARKLLARCRETDDRMSFSEALYKLGVNKCYIGRYEAGKRHLEESLAVRRQLKDSGGVSLSQAALALYATRVEGDYRKARTLSENSLAVGRSLTQPAVMSMSLVALSDVACWQERYREAARRAEESLQITAQRGDSELILFGRDALALALCGLGAYRDAKRQICQALRISLFYKPQALTLALLAGMALILAQEGDLAQSIELHALATTHPARLPAWTERLPLYANFRAELEENVSPEVFARAWGRGKERDLEEAVTGITARNC